MPSPAKSVRRLALDSRHHPERRGEYRTTDAGYSWSDGMPIAPVSLFGLTFADAMHGWASGENGTVVHLQAGK